MSIFLIYFSAFLFALMGIASIVRPTLTAAQFGILELGREGRNEVRAVYGGFGLAMSSMLVAAALAPEIRMGVTLTISLALAGMAFGRILSALIDRGIGCKAVFYFCLESLGFLILLWVSGFF